MCTHSSTNACHVNASRRLVSFSSCQILLEKSLWRATYNKFQQVLRRHCVTYYATLAILNFICTVACENILVFLKSVVLLFQLCFILSFFLGNRVFRRFLEFFFLYRVIMDVSCISIFICFFYLRFVTHFSQVQLLFAFYHSFQFLPLYYLWCGPALKNAANVRRLRRLERVFSCARE